MSPNDNIVYFGSADSRVYARPARKRELWSYTTGGAVKSKLAVSPSGDVVYAGSEDSNLYALDASSGRLVGALSTQGPNSATVSPSGDIFYVGSSDGGVYALSSSFSPYDISQRNYPEVRLLFLPKRDLTNVFLADNLGFAPYGRALQEEGQALR